MPLQFDTSKKAENEFVLEKRVPLRIKGINYVYLMTNDFTVISEKLKSFGCSIPEPEDFIENPSLSKNVLNKMILLNATWSLVITPEVAVLNYYDGTTENPYMVPINILKNDNDNSSIIHMFNYILENKTDEIKKLVKAGYDINKCIEKGATPLILACSADSYNSAKILIELGADINVTDANGRTPLMFAAINNSVYCAKVLLAQKDIQIEQKDQDGTTALLFAAANNSFEVLQFLIEAGADINAINYYGHSALCFTLMRSKFKMTRILIENGANINYTDKMGRTPLIIAANYNNLDGAEKLIKSGADTSLQDINKNTAFLVAAEKNSARVLQLLIDSQDIAEEEYTQAVIKSAMKNNIDALVTLLDSAKKQKDMVFTALTSACLKNNSKIIHVCMDYECDLNRTLYFGMTPLMMACYSNANETVAQLIAYGADVNKVDEDGISALMYTASKNNPKLLTLLNHYGADKNIQDINGKTFEDYTQIYDSRTFSQFIFDRMNSQLVNEGQFREDNIPKQHQSFSERFDWYMQKYRELHPEEKQSSIWKNGGLSRQTFSKIISNRKQDSRPKKDTVIQIALGLRLTLNETEDLLQSAGYTFSERDKKDMEIKNLLAEKNYEQKEWTNRIYQSTGKIFFNALIESEEEE